MHVSPAELLVLSVADEFVIDLISSTGISQLFNREKKNAFSFFNCTRKNGALTESIDVLRSLLSQLALSLDGLSISDLILDQYVSRERNC